MPKFTPGPWSADRADHIRASNGEDVALVGRYVGGTIDEDVEATANARLIAAAPELYEALHNALAAGLPDTVAIAARAALAKADGETP